VHAEYVAAVLADSPKAFWQCQDASGGAVDSIAGADMSTVTGTPDYQQPGPMDDFSIRLLGGEKIAHTGPVSVVTNNFTLELIFHLQALGGGNQAIFDNGNLGSNGWGIITDSLGGRGWRYLAGGVAIGGNASISLPDRFAHVVCTRNAGTWFYFVDGVSAGSGGSDVPNAPSGGGTTLNRDVSIQGAYSYAAIYETALSGAQVAAHFAAMTAGGGSAYWLTTL
jgi:hypothetical protein